MPLTTLPHPEGHIASRDRTIDDAAHYGGDDFLINQAEIIQFDQIAEVTLGNRGLDAQYLCALSRESLEATFKLAAIFPTPEEDQRITVQFDATFAAHCKTGFKQLDHEVAHTRCGRAVAVVVIQLLPQEGAQPAAFDHLDLAVFLIG